MSTVIPPHSLDPPRQAALRQLTATPRLALPTVLLWLLVVGGYVASDVLSMRGQIPLSAGMVINSVIGYYAFTGVHDSIHRAISTNPRVNDWIGQTAVFLGAP